MIVKTTYIMFCVKCGHKTLYDSKKPYSEGKFNYKIAKCDYCKTIRKLKTIGILIEKTVVTSILKKDSKSGIFNPIDSIIQKHIIKWLYKPILKPKIAKKLTNGERIDLSINSWLFEKQTIN